MSNRVEARDRAILALAAMVLQQEQQTQQSFGDMIRPMRTHRPFDIDEVDDVDIDDALLSKACAICACDFRQRDKYVKVVPKCHHAFHELCLVKVSSCRDKTQVVFFFPHKPHTFHLVV
jgi:hypothetical protein